MQSIDNLECTSCQNLGNRAIDFPLKKIENLFFDPTYLERAGLYTCVHCTRKYLGLEVAHKEDEFGYWAQPSEEELQIALSLKDKFEVLRYVREVLQQKKSYFFCSYEGKYYFKKETPYLVTPRPSW